ncbi:preprotein translocase subunit SecA [Rhodopirellula sp. MGV]|uniref:preprotein translocase subunit SecA n=1 Tax=Rhodopirellula sp. MGV TaxID=2023130 RepID=UPI000B970DE3|nr:preprotein translocase subunit SecA [Rhodopirellula sp. MGV]OYP34456.1 hypothetical protein CGZ80_15555 [Rhodopirellula sp. MGV]PNY37369.1 preprotein translocase subunit SecA [Rhodopirellula baltica]
MSLLKKLFGRTTPKNVTIEVDSVWQTDQAKHNGISQEIERADRSDAVAILTIAHFPDSLDWLQAICESCESETPLMAVLAKELSADIAAQLDVGPNDMIQLVVAERHPLTRVDDKVLKDFAAVLPCRCRVTYHLSLEEPLMQQFGGERISKMLEMLGMQPDERIESPIVTRAIRNAQKKISENVSPNGPSDLRANSMQEWFDKNVRK